MEPGVEEGGDKKMSDTPTSGEKFNHWAAGRLSALYARNNMVEID